MMAGGGGDASGDGDASGEGDGNAIGDGDGDASAGQQDSTLGSHAEQTGPIVMQACSCCAVRAVPFGSKLGFPVE